MPTRPYNPKRYNPKEIEPKWQRRWEENETFTTKEDADKPKYYVLDMFPYPSGQGLHVGHPKGYVASDIVARYKRMRGYNVLHPMGWDAFGLPTERQAAKEGRHPAEITERNIGVFRRQLKMIGLSYDWEREFSTTDPDYYRWTQWIFLKLYERGLAYQAEVAVNWCPALGTVLANEEVKDGVYVETGNPVEKRLMRQWMLKITAYAERLLEDLDSLDWPQSVKEMQRNWIGRSEGALVSFEVKGGDKGASLDVFTTRPDTLFGGTYCVLAPEHPMTTKLITDEHRAEAEQYIEIASNRLERERLADTDPKTGVFTGSYAINPATGEAVQIWIADYVLMGYGTGAIFACPAHDERDYAFAKAFDLPIVEVVSGGDISNGAYTGDGLHVNSGFLDGLDTDRAKAKIIEWLEENGRGEARISYRLRNWLFSRQRYWGEPIPILHLEDGSTVPVPEEELPVLLPHLADISPTKAGEPPLSRATEWLNTKEPKSGAPARRETNTMPQWAGSCWYYLRFIDPKNDKEPWNTGLEKKWMPVDLYIGGTEHATLHLLYARFWHKVLYDAGLVSTPEPFQKLFNQGMIQARSFKDKMGKYHYPEEAEEADGKWVLRATGEELESRIEKMSKSRYNVVTPDEVIEHYGADCLRLYEMFVGPLEDDAVWQTENIAGIRRFLERAWRLLFPEDPEKACKKGEEYELPEAFARLLHKTIKKVTEDIDRLQMNTAISALMIAVNEATKLPRVPYTVISTMARLLSPFAPHIAEEMWETLGGEDSIANAPWPEFDPGKIVDDVMKIPVQINGKLRGVIEVERGLGEEEIKNAALKDDRVLQHLQGAVLRKVIYVPNKLVNFVVSKQKQA